MGAGIAAHLAAAGCKTHLLDILPKDGSASADSAARSAVAQAALRALPKSKPPALMSPQALTRLVPGNFEDDLERAAQESDLIIEAVVERLDVKSALWQRASSAAKKTAVLATNTSGISIDAIAEGLSPEDRLRFLGLHFFNPPRFMHLLEVVPGRHTSAEIVAEASWFCDVVLGKGIVACRDTPNFVGNRIGIAELCLTFAAAEKQKLSIEDVDVLNGQLMGRPRTGSFRLADLVGIDVLAHVVKNLETGLSSEPTAENFDPLHELFRVPEPISGLIASGRLGNKTRAGFYKKTRNAEGKTEILAVDLNSLEYRPSQTSRFLAFAQEAKSLSLRERASRAMRAEDAAGQFLRDLWFPLFNYCAHLCTTICETPAQIDDAMRWGYGWELGPFELLDAVGTDWVIEQLKERGEAVAEGLRQLRTEQGKQAQFYEQGPTGKSIYVPGAGFRPLQVPQGMLLLDQLPPDRIIFENPSARLLDIGDEVACLEFRSKANILDAGVVKLVADAPQMLIDRGYRAMVLGNQAAHFCRGADLSQIAELINEKDFDGVERAVADLQDAFMNLRHSEIPVVAAPLGQALGGGTEACLHCDRIQAGADLFLGLVEVGVGLLPAGGGLKEIARRASAWANQVPGTDPGPWLRRGFEAVATAKVHNSAFEAQDAGFLSPGDGISFHRSRIIADAKKRALALAIAGYVPPDRQELIQVVGAPGGANLMMGVQLFEWGGYASAHDALIGKKIAHVLSGGMSPSATAVTAQTLLDLEREAFVSLCGEEKTVARIVAMLRTKKPLRN